MGQFKCFVTTTNLKAYQTLCVIRFEHGLEQRRSLTRAISNELWQINCQHYFSVTKCLTNT